MVSGQKSRNLKVLTFPILWGKGTPTGNNLLTYLTQWGTGYPPEYNLSPLEWAIAIIINLDIPLSAQNLRYHGFKGVSIKLLCGLLLKGV